ncbi:MAG: hypothetical protein WC484_07075 [Candidatus Omnitrophota bacterium]
MAWVATNPSNDELLINFPAQCRANWDALALGTDAALLITNAKVHPSAGIVDTKLAQITTAAKVSGAALCLFPNIPGSAGLIPIANIPIDIDGTLAANSDSLVPTQKAVKTYAGLRVISPATNSDGYIPQWNGADSKTLKNGLAINGAGGVCVPAGAANAANGVVILGADGKLPVLDGVNLTNVTFPYTAGSYLETSSDTEKTISAVSYTKMKEIRVGRGGVVTASFDIKNVVSGYPQYVSYGRIYVNGVAVGTQRSNATNVYATYSQNFTVNAGDLIQVYAYITNGSAYITGYIKNFRVYCGNPLAACVTLN